MTRLDGRFLKPGSIPADRLDPAIPPAWSPPDGSVTAQKLAPALLRKFAVVTWGAAQPAGEHARTIRLRLRDLLGNGIPAARVLRVTCDERAALAVDTLGVALSGADTSDLIAQTDAQGRLDLLVTCPEAVSITLAAGPTQGSPWLDATATADVSFT